MPFVKMAEPLRSAAHASPDVVGAHRARFCCRGARRARRQPARRAGPTHARQGLVSMWGAPAGRASVVVVLGGSEEAGAARRPHTCKTGSCLDVGRARRARFRCRGARRVRRSRRGAPAPHMQDRVLSRCGARPPGALLLSWCSEGKKKPARRAGPTREKEDPVSMWGAPAGRASVVVVLGGHETAGAARRPHTMQDRRSCLDVGRARRARFRCRGARRVRRSRRGAPAPHKRSKILSRCGARPPGALLLSWCSEEKKKPARRAGPHMQDRVLSRCGARPPGALPLS